MDLAEYKSKYEKESLVVFLDILGFKEMAKHGVQDHVFEFLYLIKNLNRAYKADLSITQGVWLTGNVQPTVSSSSDHIIISLPLEPSDFPDSFQGPHSILFHHMGVIDDYIANIQLLGLERNILLRGAIALGLHYHDWENNVIVGSALIESIVNETKLARYPRTIISESFLKYTAKTYGRPAEKAHMFKVPGFRCDFDGMLHVDYLDYAFILMSEDRLTNLRTVIEKGINDHYNNFSVLLKWKWLTNYFNAKVEKFKTPETPKPGHFYRDIRPIRLPYALEYS